VLEAQLRELEARRRISVVVDRTAADIIEDEVGRIEAELEQMRARRQELTVRSQTRGRFQLARAEDLPGHFVRRGSPLGYVVGLSEITVRAVVAQEDVDRVRGNTRKVRARLAEALLDEIPARIVREVPAASHQLPSLALSLEGGGAIALDPTRPGESQAFERLFQFDIALPDAAVSSVGGRVYVRFEHDPEPLAFRWYRSVRRLLLSRFDV
jgi:putative peptide zinc metalloprotease protein